MTDKRQGKVSSFEVEEPGEPGRSQALPGKQLGSPNNDFSFYFTTEPPLGEQFLDFVTSRVKSIWSNVAHRGKRPLTRA